MYSKLEEKDGELSDKQNNLIEKDKALRDKESQLSGRESQLNLTSQNLAACREDMSSLKEQDAKSKDEIRQLQISLDNCNLDKKILTNSLIEFVKPVCCSYDDASKGRELKWSFKDGRIACDGQYKINCGSGVTDYPK